MDALTTTELADWTGRLVLLADGADQAELVDQLRLLEEVKAAACAAQARVTVAFKRARLEAEEAAGIPARQRGRGLAAEVALARRESPHTGSRLVGLAQALVEEMPHTLAALEAGLINEWRATLVVRETACLTREQRNTVDAGLGQRLGDRLGNLGDREVQAETRKLAYRLDPHSVLARARRAETERRVALRPAPDTMTYMTALLPLHQGVAAYAALTRHADTLRATGDHRSRGQLMADTLVSRLTGQQHPGHTPVEVQLLVSDTTLAGNDDRPALLTGPGTTPVPVPAPWARDLVRDTDAEVWVRRLYTRHGRLVGTESTRRHFPTGLRRQIIARDQLCRTPWCGAPIRHLDHTTPPTRADPPPRPTAKACAEPATTPNKPQAGQPPPHPKAQATKSPHPPPPATPTAATPHHSTPPETVSYVGAPSG